MDSAGLTSPMRGEGQLGEHAARFLGGSPGVLQGTYSYVLQDRAGQIALTHSVSAGLDYPSIGPEHAWLKDTGRAEYVPASDAEALEATTVLARTEGGAPLVTTAGTWMARIVAQYDAGLIIDNPGPESMMAAVRTIISDFGRYQRNAREAGMALQQAHSAGHLYKILTT